MSALSFVIVIGFSGVALLITWQVLLAARDVGRFEGRATVLWDRGLCPYCGTDRRDAGITCPECGNYIEGYRREAARLMQAKP